MTSSPLSAVSRSTTEASSRLIPSRAFTGRDQVRINWSSVFEGVPDFRADLIATAFDGATGWAEWRWTGTRSDGSHLDDRGVTIFGVTQGLISWGRLYLEPVEDQGQGITAAVDRMRGDVGE